MFNQPKPKSRLQTEIDRAVLELADHQPHTDEYNAIVERLIKLNKINAEHQQSTFSPDVMLTVGANLLGILMILRHEDVNVITSKAMNFIPKFR